MKKTTLVLAAMLCAGVAQMTAPQMSEAQPAPKSFSQIFALGKQDLNSKDFGVAEEDGRGLLVLARSPQEKGQALRLLGEALFRRKAFDEAKEQWNTLLALTGTSDDEGIHAVAHIGLSRIYSAQGNYEEAIPQYKSVVNYLDQKGAGEAKVYKDIFSLALVDTYYNARQDDLAQEQLDRLIASAQDNPAILMLAHTRAAQINYEQGNYDKARSNYQQVLKQADAGSLKAVSIRTFATNQIAAVNDSEQAAAEAKLVGDYEFILKRSPEFDRKVSQTILGFISGPIADKTLEDKPFTNMGGK